jgi:flagellar protein FlgJ
MTRTEFFATLAPHAIRARKEGSPLFVSVRLAQNLLETGGKIHSWNNLGGIKVGSGKPNEWWDGSYVKKGTWEVVNGQKVDTTAAFRAYKSIYHFYKDQDLLFQNKRYERVRNAKTPEEQAEALRLCGYATDPEYGLKICNIISMYNLKKYDQEADVMLNLSNYQWQRIETGVKSLLDRKIISDQGWLEKAQKRTLTRDELAWLTFELVANPR